MAGADLIALASTGTLAIAASSAAALRAWNGWLQLNRDRAGRAPGPRGPSRAELAELRARVRRLEAIADGR